MRLIVSNIHRAFPELDRYDDERRRRFVNAARGSGRRQLLHAAIVLGAAVALACVCVGTSLACFAIHQRLQTQAAAKRVEWEMTIGVVALLVGFFGFFAVLLLGSDWLLCRRVRYVLRERAVCIACRYGLVGMPVSVYEHGASVVACPECGTIVDVDPSLGELTTDEQGRPRYSPQERKPSHVRAFWKSPRGARVRTWLKRGAIVAPIALLCAIGWWEWRVRSTVAQASRDKPNGAGLMAHVGSVQPGWDRPGGVEFFDLLARATNTEATVRARVEKQYTGPAFQRVGGVHISVDVLYAPAPTRKHPSTDPGTQALDDQDFASRLQRHNDEVEAAMLLYEAYKASPLFAEMDALATWTRANRALLHDATQPAVNILLPELSPARSLVRTNGVRMHLAALAGDSDEFVRALRSTLSIARAFSMQFTMIDRLVSIAIESLAYDRLSAFLDTHPSPEVLGRIAQELERAGERADFSHSIRGEELSIRDSLCWLYSQPSVARWGRLSNAWNALGGFSLGAKGTYQDNVRELRLYMDAAERAHEQGPATLASLPEPLGREPRSGALGILLGPMGKHLSSEWQVEQVVIGVRARLALERYYAEHERYPPALADLVPGMLPELPSDLWSGGPLRYKVGEDGASFVLYSVGGDKDDDGGTPTKDNRTPSLASGHDGDFVLQRFPAGE
jgi:ribosomal protein S27E